MKVQGIWRNCVLSPELSGRWHNHQSLSHNKQGLKPHFVDQGLVQGHMARNGGAGIKFRPQGRPFPR